MIYTGLAPIASFLLVLYFDHTRIENPLRNSGVMSSFFCMQFICPALYIWLEYIDYKQLGEFQKLKLHEIIYDSVKTACFYLYEREHFEIEHSSVNTTWIKKKEKRFTRWYNGF